MTRNGLRARNFGSRSHRELHHSILLICVFAVCDGCGVATASVSLISSVATHAAKCNSASHIVCTTCCALTRLRCARHLASKHARQVSHVSLPQRLLVCSCFHLISATYCECVRPITSSRTSWARPLRLGRQCLNFSSSDLCTCIVFVMYPAVKGK